MHVVARYWVKFAGMSFYTVKFLDIFGSIPWVLGRSGLRYTKVKVDGTVKETTIAQMHPNAPLV